MPIMDTSMTPQLLSDHTKPSRQHFEILFMAWAGWVFDFYDLILFTFLLVPIGHEFNMSNVELSYILGSSLGATAIGGVVFGFLSDKYGRKNVLQWTILTYSLGTVLSGVSGNLFMLLLFRVITGLGVGGEWATGQTYVNETFPPKLRGRYAAVMQTGAVVGIILASVVGGFVAESIGWRACFYISVLPALLVIVIRKRLPESDMWAQHRAMRAIGRETISEEEKHPFVALFSPAHRAMFVKSLVLAVFDMSAYWFTYSWLPGYLHQERHFPMAKSAAWMLVTQAGALLGYLSFGFVADRIGRRPSYSIYCAIMAIGLVMITVLWNAVESTPALILLCMFLVGLGTGMFSGYGPLFAEIFPTSIRNTAMGSAFNMARGVQFFTPVIIAVIAREYGLGGGISLAAIFALLTGIWVWVFPETKGTRLAA